MIISFSALLLLGVQVAANPAEGYPRLAAAHDCLVSEVGGRVAEWDEAPPEEARREIALAATRACEEVIDAYSASGEPVLERGYSYNHTTTHRPWVFISAHHFALGLINEHFADAENAAAPESAE